MLDSTIKQSDMRFKIPTTFSKFPINFRNLTDLAYANDPRVASIKAEQKRHKEERKNAKKAEQQARKDKEDKVLQGIVFP